EEREAARCLAAREELEGRLRASVRESIDPGATLSLVVEALGRALGVDRVIVGLPDPQSPTWTRITHEYRARPELPTALGWRLPPAEPPPRAFDRALKGHRGPLLVEDSLADPRFGSRESIEPNDLRSWVYLDLIDRDTLRGGLQVGDLEPR